LLLVVLDLLDLLVIWLPLLISVLLSLLLLPLLLF
jgi:hypothetical protein